jgi:hypothetical protein
MSIYSSIYIPRMSIGHNEESIKYYMEHYRIGIVSHIDFTPINKKPGFGENVDEVVKSAFIHFSEPWFCSDNLYYFQSRTYMGNNKFWETIASGQPYKLQVSDNEYWLCLKNKNPVQRTMMNIHQVVENGRHLEGLIEAQANKIEQLEIKLDGIVQVVNQLISGLFHYNEQKEIIRIQTDMLFCRKLGEYHNDTSKWGFHPTTRQGDECEKRISELEEKFKNLYSEDDKYERKIYDEYIRLGKMSEQMEAELSECEITDTDERIESFKREIGRISQEIIDVRKMFVKKSGLPWSYLSNKYISEKMEANMDEGEIVILRK